MRSRFLSYIPFSWLLLVFLLTHLYFFRSVPAWWDEAVYVGIGQYLFSLGQVGLYESIPPPLWPLVLGLFGALGLDPVSLGRWLTLLLSVGLIALTYRLGLHFFDRSAALLAAALVAFSPTFFFFSYHALSDIPASFLGLLAVYFLVKKRLALSGMILGLAFLTRFPAGLLALTFLALPSFPAVGRALGGMAVPLFPYLAFMRISQGSFVRHFALAHDVVSRAGLWLYAHPWYFYALQLLKENPFYAFLLLVRPTRKMLPLLLPAGAFLLYFSFLPHKEARFLLLAFPFLALLAAGGVSRLFRTPRWSFVAVALVVFFFWVMYTPEQALPSPSEAYRVPASAMISTSPFPVLVQETQLSPAYFPFFTPDSAEASLALFENSSHWDAYLYDSCAVPCPPSDKVCEEHRSSFMKALQGTYDEAYSAREGSCVYAVYTKRPPR